MKIIIISPAYPLRGGIADTNESLCRAFIRGGHNSIIVSFKLQYPKIFFPGKTQYSNDSPPQGLNIMPLINSINPINWIKISGFIKRQRPDFVVVRYWLPLMSPCLGTICRLINKKTRLIAIVDNIIPHEGRIGDKILTKYFVASCPAFVTLSKLVKRDLELYTSKNITHFPHPINDNLGRAILKVKAREYLGLEKNGKYLLFFGLIRKYKGLDLMLKAMNNKRIKDLGIKLLVAGEFYDDPQKYYNLIKQYNLSGIVKIINKYIPNKEIKYFFSAADLTVQTYHTASQSGITPIAFNFDSPILVTDVGGLSEMVKHNIAGYVVSKNPTEIANSILDFYINNRAEYFISNIVKIKKEYSWDNFAQKLIKFLM